MNSPKEDFNLNALFSLFLKKQYQILFIVILSTAIGTVVQLRFSPPYQKIILTELFTESGQPVSIDALSGFLKVYLTEFGNSFYTLVKQEIHSSAFSTEGLNQKIKFIYYPNYLIIKVFGWSDEETQIIGGAIYKTIYSLQENQNAKMRKEIQEKLQIYEKQFSRIDTEIKNLQQKFKERPSEAIAILIAAQVDAQNIKQRELSSIKSELNNIPVVHIRENDYHNQATAAHIIKAAIVPLFIGLFLGFVYSLLSVRRDKEM